MNLLKEVLRRVLENTPNYENKKRELEIFASWTPAVGERVAAHAQPVRLLDDGTLIVVAKSSAWMHQLKYLEQQILAKLRTQIKGSPVKALRFRLGIPEEL